MIEDTHQTSREASAGDQKEEGQQSTGTDQFTPYLEVVNNDSQRTRAAIYVLIAALLLIFTAYRNTTYPDWLDARLAQLQHAALCIEAKVDDDTCKASKDYASEFVFQGGAGLEQKTELNNIDKESGRQLKEHINAFIRQRTDALSLRLPFFGIAMDMNDLGMVSGLLLTAILYVLFASLKSEIDDLEVARQKALRTSQKRDNLELLIMAQVLAPPAKRGLGVGQGLYVLFVLVPILHFFVLRNDWKTYRTAATLQGEKWASIETWIDTGAFGLVVIFSALCIWQQIKLNGRLKSLSKRIESERKKSG
jgi:hypothetical protein